MTSPFSENLLAGPESMYTFFIKPYNSLVRNTRFSNTHIIFAVKIDKNLTNVFAHSFIPMTQENGAHFLSPCLSDLQFFRTRFHIHRYLDSHPASKNIFLLSSMGHFWSLRVAFFVEFLLAPISIKNYIRISRTIQ